MDLNKEATIDQEWVAVENYEFKILVMIACLAQEKLAFRGTLKDMCEFLGVCENTNNKANIKKAIQQLEQKKDIAIFRQGNTWTLTLTISAERKPKIIRIKNEYINAIKTYKAENKNDRVGWENILKVLVYLWDTHSESHTYNEIANATKVSESTVQRAVKALTNINFTDMDIKKKVAWYKNFNGQWQSSGTKYQVGHKWEK